MSMKGNTSSGGSPSNKLPALSSRSSSVMSDWEEELKIDKEYRELKKMEKTHTFLPKVVAPPNYTKANSIHRDILKKERSKFYERQMAKIRAEKHNEERKGYAVNQCSVAALNRIERKIPNDLHGVRVVHSSFLTGNEKNRSSKEDKESNTKYEREPAKINRQYTHKCQLVDSGAVDGAPVIDAEEKERILNFPQKRTKGIPTPTLSDGSYTSLEMLYGINNRNVMPGIPKSVTQSWSHAVHNKQVIEDREPETENFRVRKDKMTEWMEKKLIQNAMNKTWKRYNDERIEEWKNKNQSAIVKSESELEQITKTKQEAFEKPETQETLEVKPVQEEELLYEFPPQGPHPNWKKFPANSERDEEFWNFYDKPVLN